MVAVPFKGKDSPSPAAEFAHPDVLIGLTYLAYLHEGVRMADLQEVCARLKVELIGEGGPISQRRASMIFNKAVQDGLKLQPARRGGAAGVPALEMLQPMDKEQFRPVWQLICRSPGIVQHYLSDVVFPKACYS